MPLIGYDIGTINKFRVSNINEMDDLADKSVIFVGIFSIILVLVNSLIPYIRDWQVCIHENRSK